MLLMSPENAFGHVLKMYRTNAGMSQEKLALECNLDRTYISLLERGKRQPTLGSILSLSQRLGVSASEMVKATTDLMTENE
jgi:transcriptional regulator with XRE-family HTH domain